MNFYLTIAHTIVSAALIACILLQKQGAGLGGIFGGKQENYYGRRGIEKGLFFATITFTVLFLGLGMANLFV